VEEKKYFLWKYWRVQGKIFWMEKLEGVAYPATITSLVAIRVFTAKVTVLAISPTFIVGNFISKNIVGKLVCSVLDEPRPWLKIT
jgi:hypothetical protein